MSNKTAPYGTWKSHCGIIFRTRKELFLHNKKCEICIKWNKNKYARGGKTRSKEWNTEKSKKASEIQKRIWANKKLREDASKRTVFNNFWKYRSKNPILYISPIAGFMKLDSNWELKTAKRLDELNVHWYRPNIRIPYLDNNGIEHGYFPDFFVEDYHCFIEVKSPFIAKEQNNNQKIDYLKKNYNFIKWLETEEECSSFSLEDLQLKIIPNKEEDSVDYWINLYKSKKTNKEKIILENEKKKEKEYNLLINSNINFSKFGWAKEAAKILHKNPSKAGNYIRKNFPNIKCYTRNGKNSSYGKHWWTNGEKEILSVNCPKGYKAGRVEN